MLTFLSADFLSTARSDFRRNLEPHTKLSLAAASLCCLFTTKNPSLTMRKSSNRVVPGEYDRKFNMVVVGDDQ